MFEPDLLAKTYFHSNLVDHSLISSQSVLSVLVFIVVYLSISLHVMKHKYSSLHHLTY